MILKGSAWMHDARMTMTMTGSMSLDIVTTDPDHETVMDGISTDMAADQIIMIIIAMRVEINEVILEGTVPAKICTQKDTVGGTWRKRIVTRFI